MPLTPENAVVIKTSDIGTNHFIVARTIVQASDLLRFSSLGNDAEKRKEILQNVLDIKNRILNSWQIADDIEAAMAERAAKFCEIQKSRSLSAIPDLVPDCEKFLQNVKMVVRDVSLLLTHFHGFKKTGHNLKVLIGEASALLGEEHAITQLLKGDADNGWLSKIYDYRDAVEHPDSKKRLEIENVNLHQSGKLVEPNWGLLGGQKVSIVHEMRTVTTNLLTFFEDIFSASVEATKIFSGMGIAEIPEDERDPDCPIRLKYIAKDSLTSRP